MGIQYAPRAPGVFVLDPADVLELTADANDFLDEVLSQAVDNNPLLYPVTTPPLDWTQVNKGGLPAEHWARVSLIGDNHPAIMGAVRKAIGTGQMQPVLDVVNSLQRVPYRINEHVYEFILRDGEPPGPDDDRPPVWQEQKYKEWQQASAALQAFNKDMVFAHSMLATAGRFYVPLNMDFRGRVNAIPHFSFYREDRVRALFLFADGEPIGEDRLKWLKAHVARTANGNTWSPEEKPGNLGLEQRIAWTDKHLGQLRAVGELVLRGDDPKKIAWALPKKDRYQFVAACVELVQALHEVTEFITRLPLMFDATCSGLQHMCAMIRSEEGRFVNLTPSEDGADFYGFIAFQLHQHAFDLLCDDPFDYEIVRGDSRFWSRPSIEVVSDLRENPFDRELVKGPTVSFFYGSAPVAGMKDAIIETLEKRRILTYGAIPLAFAIQRAIKRTVPQATALRNSLKKLAKLCAQQNKYLRWTTPLGMPVINCYHEPVFADIPVYLDGRRRRAKFIVGDKKEVWEECAGKGAAANFVHSADAALLHFVALACAKAGINLVTVHDCFGALAPRAGQLNEILGEQLSHLHDRHDMVADVWKYARRTLRKDTKISAGARKGGARSQASSRLRACIQITRKLNDRERFYELLEISTNSPGSGSISNTAENSGASSPAPLGSLAAIRLFIAD